MNYTLTVEGRKPITGTLDAPVVPSVGPLLITNKLAIVSRLETLFLDPRDIEVNAVAYQDADIPVSPNKGHTIPVLPAMREYLKKIQSVQAYKWLMQPWMLWINRSYVGDGEDATDKDAVPMAECIGAGYGNFVEIIGEITTRAGKFYELRAFSHDDPMNYNPLINWYNRPTLFGKCTARRRADGSILNVGDGFDVYFPNLKREAHCWISAADVELFPPPPYGVLNYAVQGASIFGWTGWEYIPLRIAERPGQLEHPTDWKLQTGSVIPPATNI